MCAAREHGADGQPVEVPLTQEELAGTTRSTINRILRARSKRGTLTLEGRSTMVLDREAIARERLVLLRRADAGAKAPIWRRSMNPQGLRR